MKRILSFLLALVLIIPMLPAPARAAATSGDCGSGAVWRYDDDSRTLTISVADDYDSGYIDSYWDDDHPWKAYRGRIQKVVIEEGIERIGACAFEDHPVLTTVSLPDTVESLSYNVFYGCTKLTTINLPESLTYIDSSAFSGCKNLASVVIPAGVTTIGSSAFSNCTRLSSVKLHNGITEIGDRAFHGCKALKSITLPNKLTCINQSAFSFTGLTSIVIPEGVTIIEKYAFDYCDSLKKVTLPDTVDVIDEYAFERSYYGKKITDVYYGGTKAQKNQMVINKGNGNLKNATWHYKTMPAPTVTAELNGSGYPKLSWDSVKDASEYRIFRATKKDGTYKQMGSTSSTTYTDGDVNPGARYFYKVRAVSGDTKSSYSAIISIRTKLGYVSLTDVTSDAATGYPKVIWEKVPYATGYRILRSSSAKGPYSEIGTTTKLNYVDKTATIYTRYYYKVQAYRTDSAVDSDPSRYCAGYCVMPRPVVKISLNNKNKPKLTWDVVGAVREYEIYRSTKKNGNYKLIDATCDWSYVDTTAKAGKTYYYKVIAVHYKNTIWNSAFSAVKSIKTR